MRKPILSILLLPVLLTGPCPARAGSEELPKWEQRLADLARLWGLLKYHHPKLSQITLDWDQALIETLPLVEEASDRKSYRKAFAQLLSFLEDPATRVLFPPPPAPAGGTPATPAEEELLQPYTKWLDARTALVMLSDYTEVAAGVFDSGPDRLQRALRECEGAEVILFDLRRRERGRPATPDEIDQWCLSWALRGSLPLLLEQDLLLTTVRYRYHSGYRPNFNQHRDLYSSGFILEDFPRLKGRHPGRPVGEKAPLLVFLTDNGSQAVFDVIGGLQTAELAWVVHEGAPATLAAPSHDVHLAGGVTVRMRIGRWINPDSSAGFVPDLTVPRGEALAKGLALARGKLKVERPARVAVELEPAIQKLEDPWALTPYPDREERLLGLFRLWQVIERFYPYKHLLDRPWEATCRAFLRPFAEAADARAYHLAAARLAACLQDSHTFIQSPLLDRFFGTSHPALRMRYIENQPVVTFVPGKGGELRPGDVLLAVDGEEMAARRGRLAPYLGASTPQALDSRLATTILAGAPGRPARLRWRDGEGKVREGMVPRFLSWDQLRRLERAAGRQKPWTELKPGIGYLDLTRLKRSELDRALDGLLETAALVVDLRGYPRGTAWLLAPRLARPCRRAAQVFKPFQERPHMEVLDPAFRFDQPILEVGRRRYRGRLAVLINEETMSQAEHTCLFLENTAAEICFVGSPTNGTDGDVTNLVLPGGIYLHFSGQGVRHGDGRQLQRRGIQPDLAVRPTIAGIRAGRDEVLAAALAHLEKARAKKENPKEEKK